MSSDRSDPVSLSEALERRTLLDSTISGYGTLLITGTADADSLSARFSGSSIIVSINGQETSFPRSAVSRLRIHGGAGNDIIHNRTNLRSTLSGEAGNDRIFGGAGPDMQHGDEGDDRLYWSPGNDALGGGNGVDRVDYSSAPVGLQLRPFSFGFGRPFGTAVPVYLGVDVIPDDGTEPVTGERDFLDGLRTEIIRMTEFNDGIQFDVDPILLGGAQITMFGGGGDDGFLAMANDIFAVGEVGNDFFSVGTGRVIAFGGPGNDTILGNELDDRFDGGSGDDSIVGAEGADELIGGDGNDTLRGGGGSDTLSGGAGRDRLYGDGGDDLLVGRGGSRDRLDGGTGSDAATADRGPDVFDQIFEIEFVS